MRAPQGIALTDNAQDVERPVVWLADDVDVTVELEHHELVDLLARALALLSAETRNLLIQRYVDGASQSEIAEHLGISTKAVSMRLNRGKQLLKRVLTTNLRNEAMAYDLIPRETDSWQETRIWCPQCGQQRLVAHLPKPPGTVSFRCPQCNPNPETIHSSYRLTNAHFAELIGGLTRPRSILNRTATWAHNYFMCAIEAKTVLCTNCRNPVHLRQSQYGDALTLLDDPHFLYIECAGCGEVVCQSFGGLVAALPQVQRFWREHGRIRTLPHREIEAAGRRGVVTSFESLVDAAQLDVVMSRDSLKPIYIHGSATLVRRG
jgi:hypothetical protein